MQDDMPPVSPPGYFARLRRLIIRVLLLALIAASIGWGLNYAAARFDREEAPAGFTRGAIHGALMPMMWPNLLVGYDVSIYAQHNVGRVYKLGYATGVNACGVVFFGFFFWRVGRWRHRRQTAG